MSTWEDSQPSIKDMENAAKKAGLPDDVSLWTDADVTKAELVFALAQRKHLARLLQEKK